MAMSNLREMSAAELRLELAEAEATRVTTWKGRFLKQDRIEALTRELIDRGCF
jgi:hypothetical protein